MGQMPLHPRLCPLGGIYCWPILTVQEEATAKDRDKGSEEAPEPQKSWLLAQKFLPLAKVMFILDSQRPKENLQEPFMVDCTKPDLLQFEGLPHCPEPLPLTLSRFSLACPSSMTPDIPDSVELSREISTPWEHLSL